MAREPRSYDVSSPFPIIPSEVRAVFSLLGVLGICIVLFLTVAATAKLVLGE